MASSTSVIVVEASRPWPTTTDSGKARSAGKSKSAERPAFASAATYATWTGIHRVNIVTPSVATPASTPSAPQPHAAEPDTRWSTQSTSPVRASRTCPAMTGAGSRLAAAPLRVTSFSMSQTATRYSPTNAVISQLIKAATAMGLSFRRTRGSSWVTPVQCGCGRRQLTRQYPDTDARRPWLTPLTPADVLAPDLRIALLEFPHNGGAALIVEQQDVHPAAGQEIQVTGERGGLADHDPRYLEEQDRTRAHGARGKRGVQRHVPVGTLPPGVAQTRDLAVRDGVAQLDPLVVAGGQQAVTVGQRGTHRDSPGVQTGPRLAKRHLHDRAVFGPVSAHRLVPPSRLPGASLAPCGPQPGARLAYVCDSFAPKGLAGCCARGQQVYSPSDNRLRDGSVTQ